MKEFKGKCTLAGTAPIMFDRYPGDNKTKLPDRDKANLDGDVIVIPALSLYSMLAAENTKSVSKQFGKASKSVAGDIMAGFRITGFELPLLANNKPVMMPAVLTEDRKQQVYLRSDVARVKGGIPNPKVRPVVNAPWAIKFDFSYLEGDNCSIATLRDAFERAGRFIGLGTFRPMFGQVQVTQWSVE